VFTILDLPVRVVIVVPARWATERSLAGSLRIEAGRKLIDNIADKIKSALTDPKETIF
jgi:hypothetical protein